MAKQSPVDVPQIRGRGHRIAKRRIYREIILLSGEKATQLVAAIGQPIPDHIEVTPGDVAGESAPKRAQDHAKRTPSSTGRKAGPRE